LKKAWGQAFQGFFFGPQWTLAEATRRQWRACAMLLHASRIGPLTGHVLGGILR